MSRIVESVKLYRLWKRSTDRVYYAFRHIGGSWERKSLGT